MYALAIIRYRVSLEKVLTVVDAHRAYLAELKARGTLIASGPFEPRTGGALLLRVPDGDGVQAALDAVRDGDPFVKSGTAQYELLPWAPTIGKKYAWLAYGTERPYGHEITVMNHSCGGLVQGQQSCKQLWVMALDVTKMASGTADPSFAPFWIPGQNIHAQYVSPQWTKAVLTGPH